MPSILDSRAPIPVTTYPKGRGERQRVGKGQEKWLRARCHRCECVSYGWNPAASWKLRLLHQRSDNGRKRGEAEIGALHSLSKPTQHRQGRSLEGFHPATKPQISLFLSPRGRRLARQRVERVARETEGRGVRSAHLLQRPIEAPVMVQAHRG